MNRDFQQIEWDAATIEDCRQLVRLAVREDLERRSAMHQVWANAHLGFMGRTPDYLNVNVMAAGMAAEFFARNDPRFGPNMANYFELVREQDLALTHALTNPQVDRSKRDSELPDPYIALGVVRETSDGIVVRGARMLATLPISDEILIFPSTVLQRGDDMNRYAMSFAVPNDTPGLSFQCREPLDIGRRTPVIPPAMRRAVIVRDRHCRFPGCDRPQPWCDAHHVVHWADGGPTAVRNLLLLCRRHHRKVHERGGFRLELLDGRPAFRRPDGSLLEDRAPP